MVTAAETIRDVQIAPGSVALWWLGQAGFVQKYPNGRVVYVDPYLTDYCERLLGLRRIMASVMLPEEVEADLYVTTHHHADHLDLDALPAIVRRGEKTVFAGSPTCVESFRSLGIPDERTWTLRPGDHYQFEGIELHAVQCDHGARTPDAVGVILDYEGVRIYHMGDTHFHPEWLEALASPQIDILIPPINGRDGNLNVQEAARAAAILKPRVVVPSHYWMFIRANGEPPQGFFHYCSDLAPKTQAVALSQGKGYVYRAGELVAM